jgi:pilus assembly protein CpaB
MSLRTIIVGILAAVCGICATVGVMTINRKPVVSASKASARVLVARTDIDLGEQIDEHLLDEIDWMSEKLPDGALTSQGEAIGKFCVAPIMAGELVSATRLGDSATTLNPSPGMRAYTIEAPSASTNLGRNLMPGNRVDIIWQTNNKLKSEKDPISVRLLQNVKILAVGQVQGETDGRQKSVTLEVKPTMDENLAFAQAYGKLSLSLRNPGDDEGVDPVETNRFKDILEELEGEQQPTPAPWEKLVQELGARIAGLEADLAAAEEAPPQPERDTLIRIPEGMQGVTIQTPGPATGLAGLLEPGDRVDLQLTLGIDFNRRVMLANRAGGVGKIPSETLIENIEVLAVDSNIYNMAGEGEKKVPQSVTLIVQKEMVADINRAAELGTLTLTLRGRADAQAGPPRTVMSVEQFVERHIPVVDETVLAEGENARPPVYIRTLRGPSPQVQPFTPRG